MADVFISYKREDRENARLIADALKALNYEVWWDIELLPGQKFSQEIKEIISGAKAAIVLWSEAAISSPYVIDEATLALSRGILIPVKLDACEIPLGFGGLHTLDLSEWRRTQDNNALQPLLKAVEYKVGGANKSTTKLLLKKNTHKPEAEAHYWREISERETHTFEEYELYLNKFGENAMFSDLARLRINALRDAKDSSKKTSAKKLLAIITTAIGFLTAVATLVIKGDEVVKLFTDKGAEVKTVSEINALPKVKTTTATQPTPKPAYPLNQKIYNNTILNTPSTATTKAQQESENKPTSTAPLKDNSNAKVALVDSAEFLARTIKYELKYSINSKGKADRIEKYFKEHGLTIETVLLYTVPSKYSNKIFYTREDKKVAIWLQESVKDISSLELKEYKPSENAEEKNIRIILGD